MKKKIILSTINAKKELYSITADEFSAITPNVQSGLLGSYIKSKNIDVDIINSEADNLSIDSLINMIEKEKPLLLGIIAIGANPSLSTMTMAGIIDFFNKFNSIDSETTTFIWGPHPTVLPERSLIETGADYIVRGEGYETIVDLFYAISTNAKIDNIAGLSYSIKTNGEIKFIHNKDVPLIKDLDSLPMIDWENMNPSKYRAHNWHCFGDIDNRSPYGVIWTSLGCPFECSYCCNDNLFGRRRVQRFRSIGSVIDEISILVEKYGVRHLKIMDELFVINHKRINEFCDKLEKKDYGLNMWAYSRVDTPNRHLLKRLKKIGINWISYGFETATPKTLKDIKKGCSIKQIHDAVKMTQDEGIHICADVIAGLWNDNIDTLNRTYEFLIKYNFEWVNIYPMFAYPGAEIYKNFKEPKSWKAYALYGYECEPAGTKYLTPKEVLKFRDETFIKYHSRKEYLDMIENKFGAKTKYHIIRMTNMPLRRRLLKDGVK